MFFGSTVPASKVYAFNCRSCVCAQFEDQAMLSAAYGVDPVYAAPERLRLALPSASAGIERATYDATC